MTSLTAMDIAIHPRFLPHTDDTEVVQEPTDQPGGVRDCAFRDRVGSMIRTFEVR